MPTVYNQATLNYNNAVTYSNIVQAELVSVLSATKNAVQSTYGCNNIITYTVSLINAGDRAYTGLTLSDDLGGYAFNAETLYPTAYVPDSVNYYVNGVLQPDPAVTAGPPLTIGNISVPANGNVLILYSVRTNGYAPLSAGSVIENTVTVDGDALASPVTAAASITASNEPCLSIIKSVSAERITGNEPVTYNIRIQNKGPAAVDASTSVSVNDTLNPPLTLSSVTFNGAAWQEGVNYAYNPDTGVFTTLGGQIAVPAATYAQDENTGLYTVTPGESTLTITGSV